MNLDKAKSLVYRQPILAVAAMVLGAIVIVYLLSLGINTWIPEKQVQGLTEATAIVSAAFSILAFAGLLYTIHQQHREIEAMEQSQTETERRQFLSAYIGVVQALKSVSQRRTLPESASSQSVGEAVAQGGLRRYVTNLLPILTVEMANLYPDMTGPDIGDFYRVAKALADYRDTLAMVIERYGEPVSAAEANTIFAVLDLARHEVMQINDMLTASQQSEVLTSFHFLEQFLEPLKAETPRFDSNRIGPAFSAVTTALYSYLDIKLSESE